MYDNRPPSQQQPQQLLTPEEVAALLGVSRLFVVRQSRSGKIPAIKIGKVYRYRATSIASWLTEQEQA
jgi:excisionase family DNA binding protein